MKSEPAGRAWCARYPTDRTTAGLILPFRHQVQAFIYDLEHRLCHVTIRATRRPEERAWLMHWAWCVGRGQVAPGDVPVREDIAIAWTVDGAKEMASAYGLVYEPSLTSRHIVGRAIDMAITRWNGSPAELYALGRQYGVIKLEGDEPHWSDDGH